MLQTVYLQNDRDMMQAIQAGRSNWLGECAAKLKAQSNDKGSTLRNLLVESRG